MTSQSAAELEREAEAARANVTETADAIRQKMTPGQLIDEFTGMFSGGDTSAAMNNLKSQVRDNPLPLALIGTGLAWLMFGPAVPVGASHATNGARRASDSVSVPVAGGEGQHDGHAESLGAWSSAEEGGDGVLHDVARRVGDAAESARHSAGGIASSVNDIASSVNATAADALRSEPLILAALGLAMGTVAGALLPRTEFEKEQLGPIGSDLRHKAESAVRHGLEEAKAVAGEAYESLKEEADDRMQDDGTIAEKVSDVVRKTAAKTEDNIRGKLGQPGQ